MKPLSEELSKNPYIEFIPYSEFLNCLVERLEKHKVFAGAGGIHDINNMQGLIINQVRILDKKINKVQETKL